MTQRTPSGRETPARRRRAITSATEPGPPGRISPHYQTAIELIGQRWTGAIIRSLLAGQSRFSDIRDSIPELSDRLLWERLKTLESRGLVERHVVNRRHTEYALTAKGRALEPVVRATAAWAQEWMATRRTPPGRSRSVQRTA